ncbi:hypothetical protein [Martelella sp. HB161492]|uniref:hypothetical protein n=1 Tax=Martelella sp. HB161492 TaxID=2720726 RepID=UPI0015925333|nr:hypothetical protein [Martelella sp. HB161492]
MAQPSSSAIEAPPRPVRPTTLTLFESAANTLATGEVDAPAPVGLRLPLRPVAIAAFHVPVPIRAAPVAQDLQPMQSGLRAGASGPELWQFLIDQANRQPSGPQPPERQYPLQPDAPTAPALSGSTYDNQTARSANPLVPPGRSTGWDSGVSRSLPAASSAQDVESALITAATDLTNSLIRQRQEQWPDGGHLRAEPGSHQPQTWTASGGPAYDDQPSTSNPQPIINDAVQMQSFQQLFAAMVNRSWQPATAQPTSSAMLPMEEQQSVATPKRPRLCGPSVAGTSGAPSTLIHQREEFHGIELNFMNTSERGDWREMLGLLSSLEQGLDFKIHGNSRISQYDFRHLSLENMNKLHNRVDLSRVTEAGPQRELMRIQLQIADKLHRANKQLKDRGNTDALLRQSPYLAVVNNLRHALPQWGLSLFCAEIINRVHDSSTSSSSLPEPQNHEVLTKLAKHTARISRQQYQYERQKRSGNVQNRNEHSAMIEIYEKVLANTNVTKMMGNTSNADSVSINRFKSSFLPLLPWICQLGSYNSLNLTIRKVSEIPTSRERNDAFENMVLNFIGNTRRISRGTFQAIIDQCAQYPADFRSSCRKILDEVVDRHVRSLGDLHADFKQQAATLSEPHIVEDRPPQVVDQGSVQ